MYAVPVLPINVWVVQRPSQSRPYMLALRGAIGPADRMAVPPGFETEEEGTGEDANVSFGVDKGWRYCWIFVTTPHWVVSTLCSCIAMTSMLKSRAAWTNIGNFPPVELKLNPLILIPAILVCFMLLLPIVVPTVSLSINCFDVLNWVGNDGGVVREWLLFRLERKVAETLGTVIPVVRDYHQSYLRRILHSCKSLRRNLFQPNLYSGS